MSKIGCSVPSALSALLMVERPIAENLIGGGYLRDGIRDKPLILPCGSRAYIGQTVFNPNLYVTFPYDQYRSIVDVWNYTSIVMQGRLLVLSCSHARGTCLFMFTIRFFSVLLLPYDYNLLYFLVPSQSWFF